MPIRSWDSLEWKRRKIEILKVRNKCEFCGNEKSLVLHHLGGEINQSYVDAESYPFLEDKEIIVLCSRCHIILHEYKKRICRICKQNYHSLKYSLCYKCSRERGIHIGRTIKFDKETDENEFFPRQYTRDGKLIKVHVVGKREDKIRDFLKERIFSKRDKEILNALHEIEE